MTLDRRRQRATGLSAEPARQARALATVHEAAFSGSAPSSSARPVISDSWRRSMQARIDLDVPEPVEVYRHGEIEAIRAGHPLAEVLPVLRGTLTSIADEAEHIMIVTDAEGHILWCEGTNPVRRQAERLGLAEGTRWTEDAVGTNAMGTALAVDGPVQVYSAEHMVRWLHAWSCAASPVHDPDTGRILGTIDISGPLRTIHPALVKLVSAAAQLAEGQLRLQLAARDERLRTRNMRHLDGLRSTAGALLSATGRVLAMQPEGWLPERVAIPESGDKVLLADGQEAVVEPLAEGFLLRGLRGARRRRRPVLSVRFLGAERRSAVLDGREVPLTLRHAEILTILAMHPAGLDAERLALHLYGEQGNPVSVRSEIHRLRAQLGDTVLQTKPYRLWADVDADFITVRELLRDGDIHGAVLAYRGGLLPRSEAPEIRDERDELHAVLRRGVLDRGDVASLAHFAETEDGGVDLEVIDQLVRSLPRTDPRRAHVAARLHRLRTVDESGAPG